MSTATSTTANTASVGPTVLKSGWGTKQGSFVTNWKRRYFILREVATTDKVADPNVSHLLLYFKSEEQADKGLEPTGTVTLIKGKTTVVQIDSKIKTGGQPVALGPCIKIESPSLSCYLEKVRFEVSEFEIQNILHDSG